MAMTLKECKKSTCKNTYYFKEIKTEKDLENLRKETIELTRNGNYECVYELAHNGFY